MNTQPAVAGAAIIAGLIVGGGTYTARHGAGAPGADGAAARSTVTRQIPAVPHVRLLEFHAPRLPRSAARSVPVATAAAPSAVVATNAVPVTRTSPGPGGDDRSEAGDE